MAFERRGRPALTAEKFLPDSFAALPGRRLYDTGDLGRYLADGRVDFLGRRDHQDFLRQHLPDYMVPSLFVDLPSFPLTASGKVDRRALPEPEVARAERRGVPVAPRDHLELVLARIWEELLGVAAIGVRDNFFELGGHSLSTVRLMARIEHELGRELPLTALSLATCAIWRLRSRESSSSPACGRRICCRQRLGRPSKAPKPRRGPIPPSGGAGLRPSR